MLVNEDGTLNYFASPTVKVIVDEGESSKSFFVHKDLITRRSGFFRKALNSYGKDGSLQWLEGEEGSVKLPEDEPAVFGSYAQLLYQGRLPIYEKVPTITADDKKAFAGALSKVSNEEYLLLAKLYVFCEKIQDVEAKGTLISAFVEATSRVRENGWRTFPTLQPIKYIYDGTTELDPIRGLLVDLYVINAELSWVIGSRPEHCPPDFLHRVMLGMLADRKKPGRRKMVTDASTYLKKLRMTNDDGNI
ncbi:uncharacterized protein K460DRAFT_357663 [Cucurbitaria berberidis CBS 394.84]|uniref:BTB domain-containing protein n=1 Tax=Cucurbitaria berberidis CBS 394.84 TaxID=1168544 RepID=A0A9P4GEI5_9PLEO|nr:uncharacterized protein K460DRAFT_357663 [Cucurbitaria berberidis CBS 394.84]KAF1844021.1 hypothetical protein K460DRAFT_357663 [Cucurbitaria berberidis CBS 394.84]